MAHEANVYFQRQYYNLDILQSTMGTTDDERRLGVLSQICLVLLGREGFLERIYLRIIASASFFRYVPARMRAFALSLSSASR